MYILKKVIMKKRQNDSIFNFKSNHKFLDRTSLFSIKGGCSGEKPIDPEPHGFSSAENEETINNGLFLNGNG